MPLIERVGRRFPDGTEALREVSLSVEDGRFLALLGPSGCGKSTLLRLIAGLDAPDSGRIVWERRPAPGEIGFVFQDPVLLPWADAAANVALPLRLRGRDDPGAVMEAVARALRSVGLEGFAGARPAALSGGMRMRVSIARALVTRPRVLLMDEPFAALDTFTREALQDDLLAVWRERRCTVVFVTHSAAEAAYLAETVALMSPRPGRIAQLMTRPPALAGAARLSPDQTAWLAEITEAMAAVMR